MEAVASASRRIAMLVVVAAAFTVAAPSAIARAASREPVAVRSLTVEARPDLGARFGGRTDVETRFRVVDTGRESVQPTVRIKVESQIGGGVTSVPIALRALAPGEATTVSRTIRSVLPYGSVHVVVSARADGRVATATTSTPVIPWFLLLALAIVTGAVVACWRMLRRAR